MRRFLTTGRDQARGMQRRRVGVFLRRFRAARSGNVAVMFAVLVVPLVACVGMAIDVGRIYRVRSITQNALDSATLAAGKAAQTNPLTPLPSATSAATAYFNATKPIDVISSSIALASNTMNTEFTLTATSWISTPFLAVLSRISPAGPDAGAPSACSTKYNCMKVQSAATASIAAGGNGGSNVEVSLMLDVTGSMDGSKLTTLISAAQDLVNTVVWTDQSQYTSRVALAPFAPAVSIDSSFYTTLTNESQTATYTSCNRNGRNCSTSTSTYAPCVVERAGLQAYTDAAPGAGAWLVSWYTATGDTSTTCTPTSPMMPLTSNRTTLNTAIGNLTANGGTAGQLGTAFAWYLISPNWASIWGTSSAPAPYSDLTIYNSTTGAPKLKKFAVLMTDGTYNTLQGISYGDTSVQALSAQTQALAICTAMKAKGIEVYTVGFQLGTVAAKTLLTSCATDVSHFYDASSESLLLSAFRDIALKISSLRLTN